MTKTPVESSEAEDRYDLPILDPPNRGFGLVVVAVFVFAAAVLIVTAACGTRRSQHRTIRFLFVLAIFVDAVLRVLFKAVISLVQNIVSDVVTFPIALFSRSPYREHDDEEDICRLVIEVFPVLAFCTESLISPDDTCLFSSLERPPDQLGTIEQLAPPTAVRVQSTAWKHFCLEACLPWLWLHIKLFTVLILGFFSLFYRMVEFVVGSNDTLLSDRALIAGVLFWNILFKYWLHAFHRCMQRVCSRWAPSFRQQGYLLDFCIVRSRRNWLLVLPVEQKCYCRFRSAQRQGLPGQQIT